MCTPGAAVATSAHVASHANMANFLQIMLQMCRLQFFEFPDARASGNELIFQQTMSRILLFCAVLGPLGATAAHVPANGMVLAGPNGNCMSRGQCIKTYPK
jgi:hypothetical protein